MADSPNTNTGKVVTFAVFSNGKKVSDLLKFKSIIVHHEVNRIGSAILKIFAGDMPKADIPESASDDFKPGQEIKIELGYESQNKQVFQGIVVAHKVQISKTADSSPLLIVECRNTAIRATVGRKNRLFEKKTDKQAITTVLSEAGLSPTVGDTPTTHTQLLQYYSTDWDFALSRADACGLVVITDGSKVTVKAPEISASPAMKISYGTDLISFDGELYAEDQFTSVESIGWDSTQQKVVVASSSPASLNQQGNMSVSQMSDSVGTDKIILQTDAYSDSGMLKSWADATLLKAGLARYKGTFSFRGDAKAVAGCIIELAGLGTRFNGKAYAGSVTHTMKEGVWVTEVGMGISPMHITQQPDVVAPAASGFLPGIEGLHIGVVSKLTEDPDSLGRIQVKIPLLNISKDTVWARLIQFTASNKTGGFFMPSVGDEVILGFLNNDPNQAIILGSLYSSKRMPPYTLDDNNYKRAIVTPEKLTVELDDEKKIITITTPGENSIVISDDGKGITLKDQNNNKLVLNDSGIKLESAKDIVLTAKGNITLDATSKATIKAKQDVAVEGLNVNLKAQMGASVKGSATAELSASGQTTVKGAMVMIN
ncbi:type VI secretion system tip protein VgrG [Bacteroides sp. 51]|uniref:type VI secretion system tip protein VgrG n=1 Tax=Bacteroides sp. 51 TaxID=2302938 RepID=UPI0013D28A39|nr:type VI secretion system tip protein VgrG [Bacteroides sp. 51]NDV82960.1 type VI secretion system tip protein VgrG [Bacteroides sp. 51]